MKRDDATKALAKYLPHALSDLKENLENGEIYESAVRSLAWWIIEHLETNDIMAPPRHKFHCKDNDGNLLPHHKNGDTVHEWEWA